MKIERIATGLTVAPILWELQCHPEFWNTQRSRTSDPASPHFGLDDIWARYGEPDDSITGAPHDSRWWPVADTLGIKSVCHDLMRAVSGVELGGVLITRIPPGMEVRPHTDHGWHARRYEKYGVQIASAPGQWFCFDGEKLETRPGDVFWFDNSHTHWVTNPTPYERITMIVCIRKEN